jgi:hypothetical protein
LGEGFTTQVVTLWCFNTVGREILTLGEGFTTQVRSYPMVFHVNTVEGRLRNPAALEPQPRVD